MQSLGKVSNMPYGRTTLVPLLATPHAACDSEKWLALVQHIEQLTDGRLKIDSRLLVRVELSDADADRIVSAAEALIDAEQGNAFNYSTRKGTMNDFEIGQYMLEVTHDDIKQTPDQP